MTMGFVRLSAKSGSIQRQRDQLRRRRSQTPDIASACRPAFALSSEGRGHRFESSRVHHLFNDLASAPRPRTENVRKTSLDVFGTNQLTIGQVRPLDLPKMVSPAAVSNHRLRGSQVTGSIGTIVKRQALDRQYNLFIPCCSRPHFVPHNIAAVPALRGTYWNKFAPYSHACSGLGRDKIAPSLCRSDWPAPSPKPTVGPPERQSVSKRSVETD